MRPCEPVREVEDEHAPEHVAKHRVIELPNLDEVRVHGNTSIVSENDHSPRLSSLFGLTVHPWSKWKG